MEDKQKSSSFNFTDMPDSIKQMEAEMKAEDVAVEKANLDKIKERNSKARIIIQKFSEPIQCEIDDIVFMVKPISVGSWDMASEEGDTKENPIFQSRIVRDCLISPELSNEEFNLLPAGLKYKLFIFLLQDFFLIAGKMTRKN